MRKLNENIFLHFISQTNTNQINYSESMIPAFISFYLTAMLNNLEMWRRVM